MTIKCGKNQQNSILKLNLFKVKWKFYQYLLAHVATPTKKKRENKLKHFQGNKFNIDQMFSNYLFFFAVCVCVCKWWCYLNIDIRQNESRSHITHNFSVHNILIHLHTEQKQAEQNKYYIWDIAATEEEKMMNKYVIQNYNVYSSLSHSVWIERRRRRNKNGIVFIASWHTDDLENPTTL